MRQLFFTLLILTSSLTAQDGWKYIGPSNINVRNMSVLGDLIFCTVSSQLGARTYRSTDAGISWEPVDTLLFSRGAQLIQIMPGDTPVVVATVSPNDGRFMVSTDYGDTWKAYTPPPLPLYRLYVKENVPGLIFAIGAFGPGGQLESLYRSMDYGRSWAETYDFPKSTDGSSLTVGLSPTTPDIYVNADTDIGGQYFYHSPDDGVTWNYITFGRFIEQLMVDPNSPSILFAASGGTLQKSTNSGFSWIEIFPYRAFATILQDKENTNLFFALASRSSITPGLYLSEDRGSTWRYDSTLSLLEYKESIESLQYDTNRKRIYIQTQKGVYIRENFLTSVVEVSDLPESRIYVFPQPARDVLTFSVVLNARIPTTLRLLNPLGQTVGRWHIASSKQITWDMYDHHGHPVPSGVYRLVMNDGMRILTERVVILR